MTRPDGEAPDGEAPDGKPGSNEVSDSSFSGPTGAQTGNSNTQINNYPAPSASSAGAGGARIAMMVTAALFVVGVLGMGVIRFVPGSGWSSQAGHVGEPTASRSGERTASPKSEQTASPTGDPAAPPTDRPTDPPADRPSVVPPKSPPLAPPSLQPVRGNLTPQEETLCVDVEGNVDADVPVQMWECNHVPGQRWQWHGRTLRSYTRCLDVKHERRESGSEVILFTCTGKPGQEWTWVGQGDGRGKLRNPLSERCLGYPQGPGGSDEQLRIYDCDSEAARVWTHHG